MIIDPLAEYVSINQDSIVMIDDLVDDWPPAESRNRNGSRNLKKYRRFMGMIFKVKSRKPYPVNRRMIVEGRFLIASEGSFWDDFLPDVYVTKRVAVWKDDVKTLFKPKKIRKPRANAKKQKQPVDFVV